MQKFFCDICGEELPPEYKRPPGEEIGGTAKLCGVRDACPGCAYIIDRLDVASVLKRELTRIAQARREERETPEFRGRGGEEKREIFRRLKDYRERCGLGTLAKRAGMDEAVLLNMLNGAKEPMERWRAVGALLEEAERGVLDGQYAGDSSPQ